MDINTLRGLSTILIMIAFAGVCWWAFGKKRKKRFDEAANLPFEDEPQNEKTLKNQNGHGDDQK
ncbi:MAG: cbb3-type cytochrome c oxidase subunit 3 [Ketobacteraceae bacterium]|nr:cbb3-type cytochrome c oxidase subunit 3 [Ketobacteraceae bacterium]